jgi:uncharacterized damage-inducible protein DinB
MDRALHVCSRERKISVFLLASSVRDTQNTMTELAQALVKESSFAAPAHILEALSEDLVHRAVEHVPHTIYQELWHLAFWQRITLDWIHGIETPYPAKVTDPFPTGAQTAAEGWEQLRQRFLHGAQEAALIAEDSPRLIKIVRCPSRPGQEVRLMTVQDQLLSLAVHNGYHLGRIVVLRQIFGAWPPPSGGFTW